VHLLRLAIQDHRLENALYLTTTLSAEAFKSAPSNMVFAFTSAMAEGVDGVVLQFVTHEFPPDVNAPSMTMLLDHTPSKPRKKDIFTEEKKIFFFRRGRARLGQGHHSGGEESSQVYVPLVVYDGLELRDGGCCHAHAQGTFFLNNSLSFFF